MNFVSRIAMGLALSLGTAGATVALAAPAAAQEAPEPDLSDDAQNALAQAQEAIQAQDYATALQHIQAAEAAAETPDDRFVANQMKINVAIAQDNNQLLEQALQGALQANSPLLTPDARMKFLQNLGALAVERDDMQAASQYFQQLAELDPTNGEAQFNVGVMQLRAENYPAALQSFRAAIQANETAGKPVPEDWYRQVLKLAYENGMTNDVTPASVALVQAYPTPDNWRSVLAIFRDSNNLQDPVALDTFRLMHATDALVSEADYFEYANLAERAGLPGESKLILDEGIQAGVLSTSKPFVKELVGIVTPRVAEDKAALAELETEAAAESNGKLALATGDGYLSYGNYAKAAELYRLALQKGGVDAAEVNTRLGIALARSGDAAGARQAFDTVTTGPRAQLADLWVLYLDGGATASATTPAQPQAPAPAPAPAPQPDEG